MLTQLYFIYRILGLFIPTCKTIYLYQKNLGIYNISASPMDVLGNCEYRRQEPNGLVPRQKIPS